jgi:glycerol-3-phosphate dehydrogenase
VYADELHGMFVALADGSPASEAVPTVAAEPLQIVPRKGEYYLLDTTAGAHVRHTVFMLPTAMGKGVLVSPTVHGNLIVGPTATDIEDKEAVNTTPAGLAEVASKCSLTVKDVPLREVITTFAGLRAHQEKHDFVIGEVAGTRGLFDCAAIESPGLTSAPAIGVMVSGLVADRLGLAPKPEGAFDPTRTGVVNLMAIGFDEWDELCQDDPAYGNVICRCCRVSEAQIVDVIHRNPAATSLDAIKRRTGATMGRCQGGFCTPKIMEILERELGMRPTDITKRGPGSELVVGLNKDRLATPDEGREGVDAQ